MLMQRMRMMLSGFSSIFNFRNDHTRGRTLFLIAQTILVTVANIFISGTFYNGFLSMYDISISGVAILNYVPYIGAAFSIFSPCILQYFKRRKPIILLSYFLHYLLLVAATTLMPRFVFDPAIRLKWLVGLTIAANLIIAPFTPAFAAWTVDFYPDSTEERSRFLQYHQIISSILTLVMILVSSMLTDALTGSPSQETFLLTLRWIAFALASINILIQLFIIEPNIKQQEPVHLWQVLRKPLANKKFLKLSLLYFFWALGSGANSTWYYHLQNHLHFSYTFINICYTWMSAICTIIFVAPWRKVLTRYSWVKTWGLATLLLPLADIALFFLTSDGALLLLIVSFVHFLASASMGLAQSNFIYMNLDPGEDYSPYIAFHTLGSSLFTLMGCMFAAWLTGLTGDTPLFWHGMEIYSLQFGWFIRAACALICGLIAVIKWKSFTSEDEIQRVAH